MIQHFTAHTINLEVLLTLFQPEGADYVHQITAGTHGFENLTTYLFFICFAHENLKKLPSKVQFYIFDFSVSPDCLNNPKM